MRSFVFIAAFAAIFSSVAVASNVVDLTLANFDEFVGSGKPALVLANFTSANPMLTSG